MMPNSGKDFLTADKGRKFLKGGDMASKMNPGFMAMMAKKKDGMHAMPGGKMMKNSAMKMAGGGMAMVMKDGKKIPAFAADGEGKMKKGGAVNKKVSGMGYSTGGVKKMMGGGMGYSIGGGIESRGKTKSKIV